MADGTSELSPALRVLLESLGVDSLAELAELVEHGRSYRSMFVVPDDLAPEPRAGLRLVR